jgi:hypothetical protein
MKHFNSSQADKIMLRKIAIITRVKGKLNNNR